MKEIFKKVFFKIKSFQMNRKRKILLAVIIFLMALSFYAGNVLWHQSNISADGQVLDKEAVPQYLSKDVDFKIFWDAWTLLRDKYIHQPVSETKMFYGALAGMTASLGDQHSMFFDPKTLNDFNQELSSKFEGIGAEIGIKNDHLTVIAPLDGTPAAKAGLKSGDRILIINQTNTTGMPLEMAVSMIRGIGGTQVKLTVMRDGWAKAKEFTITREMINIVTVKWEMKKNQIAYLKLSHFNEDTENNFKRVAKEILEKKPKAIILDMRDNPGGLLDTAISVANYWIENGVIVQEKYLAGKIKNHLAQGQAPFKNIPTVVLVNKGSASASEIVVGALRDYKKATVVGETTFGKGSVQELEYLDDGSAIKLSIAEWLTPLGAQIDKIGIKPEIEVKMTEKDFDADKDPQLDKAMELLKTPR